jgi:hypothetical protein
MVLTWDKLFLRKYCLQCTLWKQERCSLVRPRPKKIRWKSPLLRPVTFQWRTNPPTLLVLRNKKAVTPNRISYYMWVILHNQVTNVELSLSLSFQFAETSFTLTAFSEDENTSRPSSCIILDKIWWICMKFDINICTEFCWENLILIHICVI